MKHSIWSSSKIGLIDCNQPINSIAVRTVNCMRVKNVWRNEGIMAWMKKRARGICKWERHKICSCRAWWQIYHVRECAFTHWWGWVTLYACCYQYSPTPVYVAKQTNNMNITQQYVAQKIWAFIAVQYSFKTDTNQLMRPLKVPIKSDLTSIACESQSRTHKVD